MKRCLVTQDCRISILSSMIIIGLALLLSTDHGYAQGGNCCWKPTGIIPPEDVEGRIQDIKDSGRVINIHIRNGGEISLVYSPEHKRKQDGDVITKSDVAGGAQRDEAKHDTNFVRGDEIRLRQHTDSGEYYLEKKH